MEENAVMPLDLSMLTTPISLRPALTLTDEELIRFSEDNKPYKIERNNRGEITIMTPVGGIGGTHEAYVGASLYNWNEATGAGIAFLANTGFNLPDGSCLSPDAAWLSLARWNALSPAEQAGFPPLCPEFLIEVRSKSDSRRLVEEKMQLWIDNGAEQAWLVDPIDRNVTIYRPGALPEMLSAPQRVAAGAPVEGFELASARLWPGSGETPHA